MDDVYKKALKNMRMPLLKGFDRSKLLFNIDWNFASQSSVQSQVLKAKENIADTNELTKNEQVKVDTQIVGPTEKKEILNSLKDYVQKDQPVMGDKSSQIVPIQAESLKHNFLSLDDLQEQISKRQGIYGELRHKDKGSVDVIFVAESILISDDKPQNEFNCLFEEATADLFSKMVAAMKLEPDRYLLTGYGKREGQNIEKAHFEDIVLAEIDYFEPKLVIALGVTAAHGLLQIQSRLKEIHGQVKNISINTKQFKVMPLFSPNLLRSAPNMKKIAWLDMQKAMDILTQV